MTPDRLSRLPLIPLTGLLVLIVIWAFTEFPPDDSVQPLFLLFAVPLMLPLPGMWREQAKSFVLAALIALIYLCHALVTLASSPEQSLFGALETALSLFLLITASLHARWLARTQG